MTKGLVVCSTVVFLAQHAALAVSLGPVSGSAVSQFNQPFVVTPNIGTATFNVGFGLTFPEVRLALLEYPLGGIPSNATITSASLALPVTAFSGSYPLVLFRGYGGNGTIEATDVGGGASVVGATPVITSAATYDIPINAAFVQSLLAVGSNSWLGLIAGMNPNSTDSSVSFSAMSRSTPTLTIEYTPEPASVMLCGLGGMALLARRKRNR